VTVSSGTVSVGGLAIGTVSGGANGLDLVVSFNTTDATQSSVSALIEHIGYANNSDNPSSAARTVTFLVDDGDGASGIATATVNITAVNDAPLINSASVNPATAIAGKPVSFDASATDPEGTSLTYAWNFGDGSASGIGASLTHTYGATGIYTVTLTVTDADGGSTSTGRTVTIEDHAPTANAGGPYAIQAGDSLTLNGGGSSDPDGQSLSYAWDLNNDGIFSEVTGANPT